MISQVLNARTLAEQLAARKASNTARIYQGSKEQNLDAKEPQTIGREIVVPVTNAVYTGSEGEARLLAEIRNIQTKVKNAAQAPSASTLEALVGKMFIDITRRYQEKGDFTSVIVKELTDPNFPKAINLQDFYKYIGRFDEVSGSGDAVPLVQQLLGDTTSVTMLIRALGWSTTLSNLLYNSVHTMAKVNDAVAEAYTDMRNARVIGQIVAATYHWSQKVSFVSDTNQTYDENLYNAFRWGVKKLLALLDNITNRKISTAPGIVCLCNSQDSWDIMRVINGALGGDGGASRGHNRAALPISQIVEYDQGATDGFTYGKTTLSFPGVTQGKAYLLVPNYGYVLNKRGLTLETGVGSVLQLSQEDRAWYCVQTEFLRDLLGSSYSSPPSGHGSGYGAIVQIVLPTDET